MLMRLIRTIFTALACVSLAACGGGGDEAAAPPTDGFDVDAAFTALFTQGASFPGLRGSFSLGTETFAVTESHDYRPTAPGATVHTRVSTTSPATTPTTYSETIAYAVSPLRITAITNEVGPIRYQLANPLPTAAPIGTSGRYEQGIDATSTQLLWSLESGPSADTAWACLGTQTLSGGGASGIATCLNIDRAGRILKARYVDQPPLQAAYTVQ
jgi:hypothetical protein